MIRGRGGGWGGRRGAPSCRGLVNSPPALAAPFCSHQGRGLIWRGQVSVPIIFPLNPTGEVDSTPYPPSPSRSIYMSPIQQWGSIEFYRDPLLGCVGGVRSTSVSLPGAGGSVSEIIRVFFTPAPNLGAVSMGVEQGHCPQLRARRGWGWGLLWGLTILFSVPSSGWCRSWVLRARKGGKWQKSEPFP